MLTRRRNNRRREPRRWHWRLPTLPWRQLSLAGVSVAVLGLLAAALLWLLDRPIERIVVEGSFQRVSALDVEKATRARIAGAGLVSVRLPMVREALRSLAWVDDVSVERQWPRGLRVRVTEQVAAARWNDDGLINARGEQFRTEARFIPPELPLLTGPEGAEPLVAARYFAIQGKLVEAGMRLTAVHLDARGAWDLTLDNGVGVRMGRRQIDERFARFTDVTLRLVAARAADIAYVDMRYTNGFAIGWRSNPTRIAARPAARGELPDA